MAVNKTICINLRHGDVLLHRSAKSSRGEPVKCRVTGKCKTWKTRPDEFQLPVRHGLRESFYITPANGDEWTAERYPQEEE
jgi:hypothetical protein